MKPSQVLTVKEKQSLDYETVVDCHFVTPPSINKESRIQCYCRRCRRLVIDFDQNNYDEKFVHVVASGRSQAQEEIVQAWLEHECGGLMVCTSS